MKAYAGCQFRPRTWASMEFGICRGLGPGANFAFSPLPKALDLYIISWPYFSMHVPSSPELLSQQSWSYHSCLKTFNDFHCPPGILRTLAQNKIWSSVMSPLTTFSLWALTVSLGVLGHVAFLHRCSLPRASKLSWGLWALQFSWAFSPVLLFLFNEFPTSPHWRLFPQGAHRLAHVTLALRIFWEHCLSHYISGTGPSPLLPTLMRTFPPNSMLPDPDITLHLQFSNLLSSKTRYFVRI